jgi:spore coat protein CotF
MQKGYKADCTLNEKDSLQDLLMQEKTMVKVYSTAWTEGVSKGFRTLLKNHVVETASDQLNVFCLMTERDYYKVESAPETTLSEQRDKFSKVKGQLS